MTSCAGLYEGVLDHAPARIFQSPHLPGGVPRDVPGGSSPGLPGASPPGVSGRPPPSSEALNLEARRALGGLLPLIDTPEVRDIMLQVTGGVGVLWADFGHHPQRLDWQLDAVGVRNLAGSLIAAGGRRTICVSSPSTRWLSCAFSTRTGLRSRLGKQIPRAQVSFRLTDYCERRCVCGLTGWYWVSAAVLSCSPS